MKKLMIVTSCVVFALAVGSAVCATLNVEVQVAPQTLRLGEDQGGYVTVHAAIAYSQVDTTSLTLNGVPADYTKSDNRGELVAKFPEWSIKDIVEIPSATLTLSGQTVAGEPLAGSDVVRVVDCICLP